MRALTPFITLTLLVSLCFSSSSSLASSGAKDTWTGEIRPGVMVGNNEAETDFFLDLFFPVWGDDKRVLFLNPHFRFGDEGSNEQNLGLGYRGLYFQDNLILGANLFVDTMESVHDNRYNQFGFGLELLSKWMDLRGNYYLPFSRKVNELPGSGSYAFKTLGIWQAGKFEEAPRGIDGEIGVLIPFISDYVETRAYIGGYRYDSKVTDDIEGVKGRVEVRPIPLINLIAEFRDDDLSSSTYIGGYLEIPFSLDALFSGKDPFEGISRRTAFGKGARSLRERMTEKVVRDRHIKTFDQKTEKKVQDVIFVNQDNPYAGNGTYENPYHDIMAVPTDPRYKEGSWVYIFSSDKKADTYSNVDLALKDDMLLWGQGFRHPVYHLGGGTRPILDGGFTGGEPYPAAPAQNGVSSVITLAENNEVMGLTIQNGGHGIYGSNVARTNIHDNIIRNNGGIFDSGIHIENLFEGTDIAGLAISHRIADNSILNNTGAELFISNTITGTSSVTDTSIETVIEGNTVSGIGGEPVDDGLPWFIQVPAQSGGVCISNSILAPLVKDLSLSASLVGNRVRNNEEGGVVLYHRVYALAGEDYMPDATVKAQGSQALTAKLENLSIVNELSDNRLSDNGDSGFSIVNDIAAGYQGTGESLSSVTASMTNLSIENRLLHNLTSRNGRNGILNINRIRNFNSSSGEYGDNVLQPLISIDSVQIVNSYKGNTIAENNDNGLYLSNSFLDLGNTYPYLPRMTETISNSGISNIIEGTEVEGAGANGIIIANSFVAGTVTGFTIHNSVSGNTVTGTGADQSFSPWPDGIEIPMITDGLSLSDSGYAFTIENLSVDSTLSGNAVRDSNSNGIALANSFLAGPFFSFWGESAPAGDKQTETITGVSIVNTLRDNSATGNAFDGSRVTTSLMAAWYDNQPELSMKIENSQIFNNVEGNSFNENGYDGFSLSNRIGIRVDETQPSQVLAGIRDVSINNAVQGNVMDSNHGEGIHSHSYIDMSVYVSDPSSSFRGGIGSANINNSYNDNKIRRNGGNGIDSWNGIDLTAGPTEKGNAFMTDADISDSLVSNSVNRNLGAGVLLVNHVKPVSDLGAALLIFMERNRVEHNGAGGVLMRDTGAGSVTANLGDASAGTGGFNSFSGNTNFDLDNDSAFPVTAENNWWGQDTGPAAGQISAPGRVDYDPWLIMAP